MANQQMSPDQMKAFNKVLEERITEANQDKTKTKWKTVLPDLMAADVFAVAALGNQTDANGNRLLNVMMMTNKEGQQVIPFFTSPNRMAVLATPEHKTFNCMKVNTVRLFEAIKGRTAVLPLIASNRRTVLTFMQLNVLCSGVASTAMRFGDVKNGITC